MSDVPAHHYPQDHHGGSQIKWLPLTMCVGLVVVALAVVAIGQLTGAGTFKTGAGTVDVAGTVNIRTADDGTIIVTSDATKDEVASYPPASQQFLAGALRSLERMRGPAEAEGRSYDLLRVGDVTVFLEDTQTGDRISLNAFNRAEAVALAEHVAAISGGLQ